MLYIFNKENIPLKMAMHLHFNTLRIVENSEFNISVCYRKLQMISLQNVVINKSNIAKFLGLLKLAYNLNAIGICFNRIELC
jgi:hypothetical protein